MSNLQILVTLLGLFLLSATSSNLRNKNQIIPLYEGQYLFEGVDYDLMPDDIRLESSDCYAQHHKCIRRKTYFTPVCAYDSRNGYYEDYYSPCEIELFTCKYRVEKGLGGVFGNEDNKDVLFYNGEELNCLYYYRRARNSLKMDILYTGSKNPPYRSLPRPGMYLRGIDEKDLPTKGRDIRGFDGTNSGNQIKSSYNPKPIKPCVTARSSELSLKVLPPYAYSTSKPVPRHPFKYETPENKILRLATRRKDLKVPSCPKLNVVLQPFLIFMFCMNCH